MGIGNEGREKGGEKKNKVCDDDRAAVDKVDVQNKIVLCHDDNGSQSSLIFLPPVMHL